MTKANPEIIWTKLNVAKFCCVLITKSGGHLVTREINWQGVVLDDTNLDFDISKQNMLFSEYSQNSFYSNGCVP
jgi:hypothetical protein